MEVAQSVRILGQAHLIPAEDLAEIKHWFALFTEWLTTSDFGKTEMMHPNNHSTCWNMQTAVYARLAGDSSIVEMCRHHYLTRLLPQQMAEDGSFPLELKRTKPYGYSLFNLDAMVMNCLVLSDATHDLWTYKTTDGKSIRKALAYMAPYVKDKTTWPFPPDVMYWDQWPVAQPAFLFGAIRFNNKEWFNIWRKYRHFLQNREVIRNMPVRNPVIWFSDL
jgi:hypothetical protein